MPTSLIPSKEISHKIYFIRFKKVMLDRDLAKMYGVKTKALTQAVKRNKYRFPKEFMFRLTKEEAELSRSQIVTLKRGQNIKYLPYAFTEQGVGMLSSVLKSKRAIQVNIAIMKAFIRLRETFAAHKELAVKLDLLERRINIHDEEIKSIFEAIKLLMSQEQKPKRKIGFV